MICCLWTHVSASSQSLLFILSLRLYSSLSQYFLFKGACASQSFQCYDQRCIPKSRVCDGFIDCYGKLHEDENRCTSGSEKTCADSLSQAKFKDGIYPVHLGTKSKIFF